jgi:hypothetical protein
MVHGSWLVHGRRLRRNFDSFDHALFGMGRVTLRRYHRANYSKFERKPPTKILVLQYFVPISSTTTMSTPKARREDAPTRTNNKDYEDNEVVLWQGLEEREIVEIPILGDSTSITLRQYRYVSSDDRWGIHSSVWEGGLALLAYLREHPEPKDIATY